MVTDRLQFKSSQIENNFQHCFNVVVRASPFGGLPFSSPLKIMLAREKNQHNFHPFP